MPPSLLSGGPAAELLDRLPLGVSLYRLAVPGDAHSFHVVYGNPASGAITGLDIADEVGRPLVDIAPGVTGSGLLETYLEVLEAGEPRDLGTIEYGDERIARGVYAVRAVPLGEDTLAVVFEDVSDRAEADDLRDARDRLRREEQRKQVLLDAIDDVLLVFPLTPDGPGPILAHNAAAVARYGYSSDELRGMTVADVLDVDRFDLPGALEELRRSRAAVFESVHRTRDGRRLYVSTAARIIEYDGQLCVVALSRDDADRRQFRREIARANRQLEDAVAQRTAQLAAFSEDLQILHAITTSEHDSSEARFEAYLRAGCEMFDLPIGILAATPLDAETGQRIYRVEATVSPVPEIRAGVTVPITEAFCDAVVETGRTVAYADALAEAPDHPACVQRGLRAYIGSPIAVDGELFGTINFVSPEPRPNGFADAERELVEVIARAVGRQISLDRAEAERSEAERLYRAVLDAASEGIYGLDLEGRTLFVNPAAVAMTGRLASEQVGARQHDLIHHHRPDGTPYPVEDCPIYATLRDGKRRTCDTEVFWRKDGSAFPVSYVVTPMHDGGEVVGAVVLFRERVPEVLASGDRARTLALLQSVLAASESGVMAFAAVRDGDGAIADFEWLLVNPRAAEIVGRPAAGLIGQRLLEVFPGNRDAGLFDLYAGVVESGETARVDVPYAHDGLETSFRITAVAIPSEDGFTVTFDEVVDAEVLDA